MTNRFWTVPNALSVARLLGAPLAAALAYLGRESWFIGLMVVLLVTDWIDGKLARWLRQRTAVGARVDTVADVTLYVALAVSLVWLRPDVLRATWPWITAIGVTFALNVIVCAVRFRRMPSYHTWGAKSAWAAAFAAALAVLLFSWHWPIVAVGIIVSAVNLEATAISMVIDEWRADVASLWHASRGYGTRVESPEPGGSDA